MQQHQLIVWLCLADKLTEGLERVQVLSAQRAARAHPDTSTGLRGPLHAVTRRRRVRPGHPRMRPHTRRMTDNNLTDALALTIETARRAERDLFGGLDDPILERPIREGDWNPKDFQAHLTAWKARQADRFAAMREGRELPPPMEDPEEDALNAELRAARVDWDWPAIVGEADAVADRLILELRQADADVLRATDRLITGTFGNGVLHTLTHVRWLLEAGVPLDRARVAAFEAEALRVVSAAAIPKVARAVGVYDLACYHALSGSPDLASNLLREAFRMDPELVEFSRTDEDLVTIRGDLDGLVG